MVSLVYHKIKPKQLKCPYSSSRVQYVMCRIKYHPDTVSNLFDEISSTKRNRVLSIIPFYSLNVFLELRESEDVAFQKAAIVFAVALDRMVREVHVVVHVVDRVLVR